MSSLKPGTKVLGTTIAELGNRNRPLDMIVYKKDGKDFILMMKSIARRPGGDSRPPSPGVPANINSWLM